MKYLYTVSVAPGLEYDCIGDESLHLKLSDEVIVKCERYQDIGVVTNCKEEVGIDEPTLQNKRSSNSKGRRVEGQKVPHIVRRTTLHDKGKAHENMVRARSIQRTALNKISNYGLPMKLINTHYSFDGNLVVFQFTADGRVDFRQLLRELAQDLHTRVELRQVGVRDEAAIQGGLGPCGRGFCCASFLNRFVSINVKMAKQQGLSLNPSNISGACGRLKCCLNYEAQWYREREDRQESTSRRQCCAQDDADEIDDTEFAEPEAPFKLQEEDGTGVTDSQPEA